MLDSIPSFARLVAELAKFPGIGTKTATRLAFYLLRQPDAAVAALGEVRYALNQSSHAEGLSSAPANGIARPAYVRGRRPGKCRPFFKRSSRVPAS